MIKEVPAVIAEVSFATAGVPFVMKEVPVTADLFH